MSASRLCRAFLSLTVCALLAGMGAVRAQPVPGPGAEAATTTTPASPSNDKPTYTVAVVPQFPAVEIHRIWTPILTRLGDTMGVSFELKVARDIPSFEDEVVAGKPDFVYLNPYHQVRARRAQNYRPLVRDAQPLTGILVVRRDDPIRSVRELEGKSLAFPAPNAFGASLLIRAHLAEQERLRINPLYAKTHTNAYRQTIVGKTAASGGLRVTLEREPQEVRDALRILLETPGAAPHPLSVHPRVPKAVQDGVQKALLRLSQDPALAASFKDIPMPRPLIADYQRDYFPLERLKLDRYAE